jgi:hypothetical protein
MEFIATGSLITWVVLALFKVHPKAQYTFLFLFGLGVAGGIAGEWLGKIGAWLVELSSMGTGALVGASAGWAIALGIVLFWTLVMVPHSLEPAGAESSGGKGWIHWTTIIFSPLVAPMFGIVFGTIAALA